MAANGLNSEPSFKDLLANPRNVVDISVLAAVSIMVNAAFTSWNVLTEDEAQGVAIATLPNFGEFWAAVTGDGNPPVMALILRASSLIFGTSTISLKLISFAICVVIPLTVYLVIRKRLGRKLAIQTAYLSLFCPNLIINATLLRPYGLLVILSLCAFEQLHALMKNPRSMKERLKYTLLLDAFVYTHMYAAAIPFGHAFVMLYGFFRGWWQRTQIKAFITCAVASLILFIPWLHVVLEDAAYLSKIWKPVTTPPVIFFSMPCYILNDYLHLPQQLIIPGLLGSFLLFYGVLIIGARKDQLPASGDLCWMRTVRVYVIGTSIGLFVCFLLEPFYRDRYMTHLAPFIILLYVTFMHRVFFFANKIAANYAPVAIALLWWAPQLCSIAGVPSSAVFNCAQQIQREFRINDVIVVGFESVSIEFNRELPGNVKILTYPDVERPSFIVWPNLDQRTRDPANMQKLFEQMENTLNAGGRVWLVSETGLQNVRASTITAAHDHITAEKIACKQIEMWLQEHAVKSSGPTLFAGRERLLLLSQHVAKR